MIQTQKDPNSTEDFVLDWSVELGTDTISSASWTPTGGINVVSSSNTATTTTARLSGGTDGHPATATCTVTLTSAQVKRRAIQMTITEQ